MGVHTNMCVLYRPFGMVNMTRHGAKCLLVRDLTDAAKTRNGPWWRRTRYPSDSWVEQRLRTAVDAVLGVTGLTGVWEQGVLLVLTSSGFDRYVDSQRRQQRQRIIVQP